MHKVLHRLVLALAIVVVALAVSLCYYCCSLWLCGEASATARALSKQQTTRPSSVGIAYLVKVHDMRSALCLMRLIPALWRPQDTFVVHIDAKADPEVRSQLLLYAEETLTEAEGGQRTTDNVVFVTFRAVQYAKNAMVETSLDLLQYALELGGHDRVWSHAVQLSGDSYPLQPPEVIQRLIEEQPNKTWLLCFKEPWKNARILDCHAGESHPLLQASDLWHGAAFWILPRHVVSWILQSRFARNLLVWEDCGISQAEMFFQTVLQHSPFAEDTDPRTMYSVWVYSMLPDRIVNEWLQHHGMACVTNTSQPSEELALQYGTPPPLASLPQIGQHPGLLHPAWLPGQYRAGLLFARKVESDDMVGYIQTLWKLLPSRYVMANTGELDFHA